MRHTYICQYLFNRYSGPRYIIIQKPAIELSKHSMFSFSADVDFSRYSYLSRYRRDAIGRKSIPPCSPVKKGEGPQIIDLPVQCHRIRRRVLGNYGFCSGKHPDCCFLGFWKRGIGVKRTTLVDWFYSVCAEMPWHSTMTVFVIVRLGSSRI